MWKFVEYHSYEWMCLVEQGWHTVTVDDQNIATMLRQSKGY